MKKNIKITRANFPGVGNFSWMNFFVEILNEKFNVIIDSINPDIVLYTNQFYREGEMDYYTNNTVRGVHEFNDNVKKVFISGEARPDYMSHINNGTNYYALGYEHINHERYLRFPTYVLDIYVLNNEAGMFEHPFNWLLNGRDGIDIIKNKKHFCSVVQASNNPDRNLFFDIISKKYYIKSSGPWRPTINDNENLNPYKYHDYSNKNYMGKIDGLTYRDKINFFSDSMFNLSFQYTNTDYLTQEKIVHSYASNSIPIFYGNKYIEDEGFNPNTFINCHNFNDFEEVFQYVDNLYHNEDELLRYFNDPIFINNKLPIYFDKEYILNFFEKIIKL